MLRLSFLLVAFLVSSLCVATEPREITTTIGRLQDAEGNSVSVGTKSFGDASEITLFTTDKHSIRRVYVRLSVDDFKRLLDLLKETHIELTINEARKASSAIDTTITIGRFASTNSAYLSMSVLSSEGKRVALFHTSDKTTINRVSITMSPKDIQQFVELLVKTASALPIGEITPKAPNADPSSIKKDRVVFGVNVIDLPPSIASGLRRGNLRAALVVAINSASTAEKTGIEVGDVIFEFDGKPINKYTDLQKAVSETDIGKKVIVKLIRGENELDLVAQF